MNTIHSRYFNKRQKLNCFPRGNSDWIVTGIGDLIYDPRHYAEASVLIRAARLAKPVDQMKAEGINPILENRTISHSLLGSNINTYRCGLDIFPQLHVGAILRDGAIFSSLATERRIFFLSSPDDQEKLANISQIPIMNSNDVGLQDNISKIFKDLSCEFPMTPVLLVRDGETIFIVSRSELHRRFYGWNQIMAEKFLGSPWSMLCNELELDQSYIASISGDDASQKVWKVRLLHAFSEVQLILLALYYFDPFASKMVMNIWDSRAKYCNQKRTCPQSWNARVPLFATEKEPIRFTVDGYSLPQDLFPTGSRSYSYFYVSKIREISLPSTMRNIKYQISSPRYFGLRASIPKFLSGKYSCKLPSRKSYFGLGERASWNHNDSFFFSNPPEIERLNKFSAHCQKLQRCR